MIAYTLYNSGPERPNGAFGQKFLQVTATESPFLCRYGTGVMDTRTPEQRGHSMRSVRSRNTGPEPPILEDDRGSAVQRSLRDVAAELAKLSFFNESGAEFSASQVRLYSRPLS